MKVTRKDTGEVFTAQVVPGALLNEGGKYALDDPEYPIRNGNQLQEMYFMGDVKLVQDGERMIPECTYVEVAVPEEEEDLGPPPPDEKPMKLPKKKTGWPKGKKRGKRKKKAKTRRFDADQE